MLYDVGQDGTGRVPKKSKDVKDSFAKISNKIPAEKWDREATDRMFAKQLQEIVFCILIGLNCSDHIPKK